MNLELAPALVHAMNQAGLAVAVPSAVVEALAPLAAVEVKDSWVEALVAAVPLAAEALAEVVAATCPPQQIVVPIVVLSWSQPRTLASRAMELEPNRNPCQKRRLAKPSGTDLAGTRACGRSGLRGQK